MAVTNAEAQGSSSSSNSQSSKRTRKREERRHTTLDSHVDKPSIVEPGDGPADTTDPTERAISVEPDKAAAALAGYQTVNAVVPFQEPEREAEPEKEHRTETYKVPGPNGKLVTVTRDLETGESEVS